MTNRMQRANNDAEAGGKRSGGVKKRQAVKNTSEACLASSSYWKVHCVLFVVLSILASASECDLHDAYVPLDGSRSLCLN